MPQRSNAIFFFLHFSVIPYKCSEQYGFNEWNNTCYTLVDWDPMLQKTFEDAKVFCHLFGFHLIQFRSGGEKLHADRMVRFSKDPKWHHFWVAPS